VLVRRVTADDADRLRRVRLAALADAPRSFGSTYEREVAYPADRWISWAVTGASGETSVNFLAIEDDEVAGVAAVVGVVGVLADYPDSHQPTLWGIWVAPAARRRGVAGQLVEAANDRAMSVGLDELRLWVASDNPGAIALFRRHAFSPTGDRQPLSSDTDRATLEFVRRPQ
jgi:ribosomal protein S18 acetylase RimI-like enzyme